VTGSLWLVNSMTRKAFRRNASLGRKSDPEKNPLHSVGMQPTHGQGHIPTECDESFLMFTFSTERCVGTQAGNTATDCKTSFSPHLPAFSGVYIRIPPNKTTSVAKMTQKY